MYLEVDVNVDLDKLKRYEIVLFTCLNERVQGRKGKGKAEKGRKE